MKKSHYRSRTFWKIFISYLMVIFFVALLALGFFLQETLQRTKQETDRRNFTSASNMSTELNAELQKLLTNTANIRELPWVRKLYTNKEIFDSYFTAARRIEIQQEVQFYKSNSEIVREMAFIFPEQEIAISEKGWIAPNNYFKLFGLRSDALVLGQKELQEAMENARSSFFLMDLSDRYIALFQPLERIQSPRAYVFYCLDKHIMMQQIRQKMLPAMSSFTVLEDGQSILFADNHYTKADDKTPLSFPSIFPNWEYEVFFSENKYAIPISANQYHTAIRVIPFFTFLGILLSYGLAYITYRPLGRILSKLLQNKERASHMNGISDYKVIEDSFDLLKKENLQMKEWVGQYNEMRRIDLIKQLMRGHFQSSVSIRNLSQLGIDFGEMDFYQTMLLFDKATPSPTMTPHAFYKILSQLGETLHVWEMPSYEIVERLDNNVAIVLYSKNANDLSGVNSTLAVEIASLFEPYFGKKPQVSVGSLQQGLLGLSISYHSALEQKKLLFRSQEYIFYTDKKQSNFPYYPLDWETQLIEYLLEGNIRAATKVLTAIEDANPSSGETAPEAHKNLKLMSALMDTLLRVSSELELDDRLFVEEITTICTSPTTRESWNALHAILSQFCELSIEKSEREQRNMPEEIHGYVDENYCSPSLSLKELSDRFGLSVQSISKLFKVSAQDTFYSYLMEKRMEQAYFLLETTNKSIQDIALAVGYEHVSSFRRAFGRYAGHSPREHRERYDKDDFSHATL